MPTTRLNVATIVTGVLGLLMAGFALLASVDELAHTIGHRFSTVLDMAAAVLILCTVHGFRAAQNRAVLRRIEERQDQLAAALEGTEARLVERVDQLSDDQWSRLLSAANKRANGTAASNVAPFTR